MGCYAA